ncbi:MAG: 50S ribosome-binding GTPase [Phycisphaerales bacterium]|nr:50S ribosome-binding GTPase [Phycisphaerales bacterium]
MTSLPTIVAVASGWGHSPWGLVRVSGSRVGDLIAELVDPAAFADRTIVRAGFRLGSGGGLLPCWAMRGLGPRTYTGEDALELLVPGNPLVLERVLGRLCGLRGGGVREATPGEFSARAYLNGKLTIEQAEGVAAAIAAQNERQLGSASALLLGQTGARYRAWAEDLATLLALVEAGIDFTDQEDVVPIPPRDLASRLGALRGTIGEVLGGAHGVERASRSPRVVLAGRPNAGKSTLFNALLGRRRAVESPVAGTTRDVLEEPLDLSRDVAGGPMVMLVDVAGLDRALAVGGGAIDAAAQAAAAEAIGRAEVVVLCDPTGRFDLAVPARPFAGGERTVIRVRTKADQPLVGSGGGTDADLHVCALDGWRMPALKRAIADAVWGVEQSDAGGWVLPRHRRALAVAAGRIAAAGALIDPAARALANPETVADELRAALDALGEVTGAISPDDVIGRVFATFCVGK